VEFFLRLFIFLIQYLQLSLQEKLIAGEKSSIERTFHLQRGEQEVANWPKCEIRQKSFFSAQTNSKKLCGGRRNKSTFSRLHPISFTFGWI